jgi:predicted alternative tryptophan synthase beta-subunit
MKAAILFNLSGHGHFDICVYEAFLLRMLANGNGIPKQQ